MIQGDWIIDLDDLILITGSNGFIGSRVVETLLCYGFTNIRCFVRTSADLTRLNRTVSSFADKAKIEVVTGNLLSRADCRGAADGVSVIFHLAAGVGKSFPACFLNSVVATRNLLDATLQGNTLKRFLNVSSFAVYSNSKIKRGGLLDETCEVESQPQRRGEAYCYAKAKQDELLLEYNIKYNIPHVIVRPGAVYGPGKNAITGRVGIGTFGIYLHLGGSNRIPFTYIDNCAYAIVLAGIKRGVDGEVFNIVDNDLPKSKEFLKMYKAEVGHFTSIPVPYMLSYFLCYLWEKYSEWSQGQLPLVFNQSRCAAEWKGNRYSNDKLKDLLGWQPRISTDEALKCYFEYSRQAGGFKRD